MPISISLQSDQRVRLRAEPLAAGDGPGALDGAPLWASSNPNVATVAPDPGGLFAWVTGRGVGVCSITVTGDAESGPGVSNIVDVVNVTVTAPPPPRAVKFRLTAEAPVPQ